MASACVNNVGMAPDSAFLDFQAACPPYGWLSPTRISLGRDATSDSASAAASGIAILMLDEGGENATSTSVTSAMASAEPEGEDLELTSVDLLDFEFRLEDPVAMLPADELFSDGKLMPLHMPAIRPLLEREPEPKPEPAEDVRPSEAAAAAKIADRVEQMLRSDPYSQSPRAPRCSSRWRDLLGLRKQQNPISEPQKSVTSSSKNPNTNTNLKSLRQLLIRHQKINAGDSSLSLPLLHESDTESLSVSSRRSLSSSSSSSGGDHDDLPRLSLDSEKRDQILISLHRPPPKVRLARQRPTANGQVTARVSRNLARTPAEPSTPLAASVDSPRMNASGKVVFVGLERSSSSPGSFTGDPRAKYRPMERSYSAGMRVAPVLNVAVPVRSLRNICGGSSTSNASLTGSVFGFGQLFSPQKKSSGGKQPRFY